MELINQTLRGIVQGIGFSFGALLIYATYQMFVAAPANMEFRHSLIKEVEDELDQLSAEIIDYKVMEAKSIVLVTSKIKNSGRRGQLNLAPKIDFFDNKGQFLFDCYGKAIPYSKIGSETYFTTECDVPDDTKLKRVASVRANAVSGT